jgi:deoxyadenosine/deoxycytidine kinase
MEEKRGLEAQARYIVVEGPIGVGKTSLVEHLCKALGAQKILEVAEDNPFLPDFYRDMKAYAFQTQIFFLLSRYRQQQELLQFDLFRRTLISDYLFDKDKIFAYLTLDDHELVLYEQIYQMLSQRLPKPDLVIYLQANVDVLMARIKHRGRSHERVITREYLNDLNEAYNHFFFHYNDSPLLMVNTSEIDFVKNKEELEDLIKQISVMKKGTQYYIPLGSRK